MHKPNGVTHSKPLSLSRYRHCQLFPPNRYDRALGVRSWVVMRFGASTSSPL